MFIDKTENFKTNGFKTNVRNRLRRLHANGSRRDTLGIAEVAVHRGRRIPS